MNWTEADEQAFEDLMKGADGQPSYVRALLVSALEDFGGRVLYEYATDKMTLDEVLEMLKAPEPQKGLGQDYRRTLVDIISRQWADDDTTRNYLLKQVQGD